MKSDKKENVKWTSDKIKKLIELVECTECLWNVESADYRNKNKRHAALEAIGVQLEIPQEDIKQKIHRLRTQYTNERSKMKYGKSGSNTKEKYKTKWEFYDALQFMYRHTSNDTTDSMCTVKYDSGSDAIDNQDDENVVFERECDHDNKNVHGDESAFTKVSLSLNGSANSQSSSTRPCTSNSFTSKRKKNLGTKLQRQVAISRCMAVLAGSREKDEYSIFGEYVANELRLLKDDEYYKLKMKNAIQKCILEVGGEYAAMKFGFPTPSSSQVPSPFTLTSMPSSKQNK